MNCEISIPNQLNKDFFKTAIEEGLKLHNVEIINLKFSMGSSGGENYCSYIYRTLVTYKHGGSENIISLIVKYMLMEGDRAPLVEMRSYERECKLYFEILPEINKLLGDDVTFGPKCFYAVETPVRTMVFQDLNDSGYELKDRIVGLDEKQAFIVLHKIAKFHAATMIIARNKPSSMKNFDKSMFDLHEHTKGRDDFLLGTIRYLQELLSSWPNYESIISKLAKIEKTFHQRSFESVTRLDDTISVLNHGDLWVNNIMFKKNERCADAVFVDFQASYYGSLAIDLHFFLNGSIQLEVLKSKRYEFLRAYYNCLKETLEKLNFSPIPSWDDIKREVQRTEFYAFYTFETEMPLMLLDRDVCADIGYESLSDENVMKKTRETAFKSKRMLETTKYLLDRFDELGILD